jgi:succinylglutamic semialdehyde dehydrogenase
MTHFINNEWISSKGEQFSSVNPANGETIWQANAATETEVNLAVQVARDAFPVWSRLYRAT